MGDVVTPLESSRPVLPSDAVVCLSKTELIEHAVRVASAQRSSAAVLSYARMRTYVGLDVSVREAHRVAAKPVAGGREVRDGRREDVVREGELLSHRAASFGCLGRWYFPTTRGSHLP